MSYYNGSSYTFTWDGRRLATAVKGSDTMSFVYGEDGTRVSKTVNGVTTHYVYSGNLLISEYTDTATTVYIYDVNGSPIGFRYRLNTYADDVWDTYWYVKNVQGDIVEIYSSAGVKLVTYKYDAWGNTTVAYSNNGENTTAVKNNLTYRGYYYDSDLGLYYLQTRYYDPIVCRFINADGYVTTGQGITGYNMFAYCGNNPVNYVDPNGENPVAISVAATLLLLLAMITVKLVQNYLKNTLTAKEKSDSLSDISTEDILNNNDDDSTGYMVYKLIDPSTQKVEYVGRTMDPVAREAAHKNSLFRGHLVFIPIHEDLTKEEARGLEQYYMIYYHTINAVDKKNNQINGISLSNARLNTYVDAAIKYLGNLVSDEFLNWAGK